LLSERTVIKLSEGDISKKQARWQAVVRSAAEQSEGLFIPQVLKPVHLPDFCPEFRKGEPDSALRMVLVERGARLALKSLLSGLQANQPVTIAIGPEGGWTAAELDALNRAGFVPASLGMRILRSETAAMAAMAAVVYEFGP
jgi:16S rRNA (uracil1498-N3)-methyltransferase